MSIRHIIRCALMACSVMAGHLAQAQSVEQWTNWGDAAFAHGEYYGATRFYAGALAIDGGRMSLQWKQAEACRLSHQYEKAAALYERVYKKDQGRTHPDALRWLAEMQMSMGDHAAARATWHKLLTKTRDKGSFNALRAQNALLGCALALDSSATDSLTVEHLPQPLNTYDSEFGARIGPDSLLYFTSLRGDLNPEGEVLDTASYRARIWRTSPDPPFTPTALPPLVNGVGDVANTAWSPDGRWFLFSLCPPSEPCRIHIAPIHADGIGAPMPLPGMGDTVASTQPVIAWWEGREMLLFASDRPGGQGGWDIWQAEFHDGTVSHLYPLGRAVNTPGNERCPWYDSSTNVLWFSSDFLPGLGGFDIFSAAWGNDIFSTPVNAGKGINSPANDLYPVIDGVKGEGWLTSNRVGSFAAKGETCCNDLYRFRAPVHAPLAETPEVSSNSTIVPRTPTERLLALEREFPLRLYFHNDDPEPRSWERSTSQAYSEAYNRYRALTEEYLKQSPDPDAVSAFFEQEVDSGYAKLHQLERALLLVLAEGRSVSLEVRGHASPLARTDYNERLSMRRIESLRNQLRAAENGALLPYMEGRASSGARLTVRELPFGEERSAKGVSDDVNDTRRSVHSVEAMRERRIEIEGIGLERVDSTALGIRIEQHIGRINQGEEQHIPYTLVNTGSAPLRLLRSETDCGCTTAELPQAPIPPGGSAVVELTFNGRAQPGPLMRLVMVETDGLPYRYELVLRGEVMP